MGTKNSYRTPLVASGVGLGLALMVGAGEFARRIFRRAQLFQPDHEPVISWNPADYGLDPKRVDVMSFRTEDGELLHGWYCRAESPIASALYCHGNRGNLTWSAAAIRHLVERGINLFIFDYRGFGKSTGSPTVRGVVSDARAAARQHDLVRPSGVPTVLYGYSLGGAIAAQLVRGHEFDGLILQSTFTSLTDITRALYPRTPVHFLSGRVLDTLSVVRNLRIPLYVIHGGKDETIPRAMSQRIYRECPAEKAIEIIRKGTHRDLYEVAPDRIASGIECFMRKLATGGLTVARIPVE